MFPFNDPHLKQRRKRLRKKRTYEEYILWEELKKKKLHRKFRRQVGIGPYIADFYCFEKRLVIEVDGKYHEYTKEYDQARTEYFYSRGLCEIRFWNDEVRFEMQKVITKIQDILQNGN